MVAADVRRRNGQLSSKHPPPHGGGYTATSVVRTRSKRSNASVLTSQPPALLLARHRNETIEAPFQSPAPPMPAAAHG